jgi:hypothetical protein
MADVGDEVPPDFLHPAALRLVLGEQQDQAATADAGAQRGDAHREAGPPAAERGPGHLDLALADLPVPADLAGQGEKFPHHQLVVLDQAEERAAALALSTRSWLSSTTAEDESTDSTDATPAGMRVACHSTPSDTASACL